MTALCFEPVAGASGDMILGALFDLGASPQRVEAAVRSAGIVDFSLRFERRRDAQGMMCGYCEVRTGDTATHRHLADILTVLDRAAVSDAVRARAVAIFQRLGRAEAAVHGVALEQVHFHEVGAVDTIIDILGACVALEDLCVSRIFCSEFKVGRGFVKCAHGRLPVPVPATVKLLEGLPVRRLNIDMELTTPTGAAILASLTEGDWGEMMFTLGRVGCGHGSREIEGIPNIIRAHLVQLPVAQEYVEIIETDIDDDSPEVTAGLPDLLRAAGALDAVLVPKIMKKGRSGVGLQVVVRAGDTGRLIDCIFRQSSTIGVRIITARRQVLGRSAVEVLTPWGVVRAKRVERPGGVEIVPEAEAVREVADKAGVSMREVMYAARANSGSAKGVDE